MANIQVEYQKDHGYAIEHMLVIVLEETVSSTLIESVGALDYETIGRG
jgi:hypothetical protein